VDVECDNWPLEGALYVTNWLVDWRALQRAVVCELERVIAHVGMARALQVGTGADSDKMRDERTM
jgi:hypothetical protein